VLTQSGLTAVISSAAVAVARGSGYVRTQEGRCLLCIPCRSRRACPLSTSSERPRKHLLHPLTLLVERRRRRRRRGRARRSPPQGSASATPPGFQLGGRAAGRGPGSAPGRRGRSHSGDRAATPNHRPRARAAAGHGTGEGSPRRAMRSNVSGLVGIASLAARRAPASPPTTRPRWRCRSPSRHVRRAAGRAASPRHSAKVRRRQAGFRHRKRRTRARNVTGRPCQGRSPSVRAYRLCTRPDSAAQSGQAAVF